MDLVKALRLKQNARVAFVGAGGKTTALFQLARALPPPVVVTCSAHLGAWQADLADRHLIVSRPEDVERSGGQIEGVTLFTGPAGEDQRLQGLDDETLAAVNDLADRLGFPVLAEADGSRQRPLKAPSEGEPIIPGWIDAAVVVVGLSALNQPLEEGTVHRPERFEQLSGIKRGETITEEGITRTLLHPLGGLKNIPAGAKRAALLNQADSPELAEAGIRIARELNGVFDTIIVASLSEKRIAQVFEPAAGIILSGGGSSRFGQPKMLLPWRGKPLIRHMAEAALAAKIHPVVVITGAIDSPIQDALAGLPVVFKHNPDWKLGQSTSVRAGVGALPEKTGAALFLLADQPFVTPELLEELIARHAMSLAPVVAPRVRGRRANPVLFDRQVFAKLLTLEGDTGGRAVLDELPIEYLEWDDQNLLLDVDTPDDYDRLKELE